MQRRIAEARERWRRRDAEQEAAERAAFTGDCFPCRDTGYMCGALNAPCPECARGRALDAMLRRQRFTAAWDQTGVTPRCRDFSLDSYPLRDSAALADVYAFLAGWDDQRGLLLVGPYGTGKTGLLVGALRQIVHTQAQQGTASRVQFVTSTDLMDALRDAIAAQRTGKPHVGNEYAAILDRAKRVRVLAIDDLGAEKPTEFVRERLFAIVNHRYEHQLPTFVTTNYGLEQLAGRVGPRVVERLLESSTTVEVDGPNLRSRR